MEQHTWDNNYGRDPLVFFVPDELCLLTTGPHGEEAIARHERLLNEHNARLVALAQRFDDAQALVSSLGVRAPLLKDLAPHPDTFAFLREKADKGARILHPLSPASARPHAITIPTTHDESPNAALTLTHHCYHVGDANDRQVDRAQRNRRVRDLTMLTNLIFRAHHTSVRAMPNWIAAGTETGCPGPASAPEWAPNGDRQTGYWSFRFPKRAVADAVAHGRSHPSRVKVAVLDTSPTAATVNEAAAAHPDNLLLQRVAHDANVTIDRALPDPAHPLAHLANVTANWRDRSAAIGSTLSATLAMDDHGLFITGIIHDIAPHADLSLIRVLSGYGITDHHAMLHALTQAPQLLDDDQQRLVVSLSLGFAIPPGIEVLRLWLRETYQELERDLGPNLTLDDALAAVNDDGTLQHMLDDMKAGLNEIITWLGQHPRVLLVAAAGNDNRFFGRRAQRPEPRWPAHYHEVLSVAAVGREGLPANYSNRGDVASDTNGIATFGGNTVIASDGDLGAINMDADPVDAITGIYSADTLTLGNGPNETGWVYWAGTSFATPIITGLAADLWDMRLAERRHDPTLPAYGPQELIHELVNDFFSTPRDDAAPDTLGTPTIAAEQVWAQEWHGRA